jgi:flagellar biosynthesis/type III secretory pathway protein FliH
MLTKTERHYTQLAIVHYIAFLKELALGYEHGMKEGYYDESYQEMVNSALDEIAILESAWDKTCKFEVEK